MTDEEPEINNEESSTIEDKDTKDTKDTEDTKQKLSIGITKIFKTLEKHTGLTTKDTTADVNDRLTTYESLSKKKLKTEEEKHQYEDLLKNEDLIKHHFVVLSKRGSRFSDEEETSRIHSLDFLKEAYQLEGNPQKEFILESIKEFLSGSKNIFELDDQRQIKSIAGDVISAYGIIVSSDPQIAIDILSKFENTPLYKMLNLSYRMHL